MKKASVFLALFCLVAAGLAVAPGPAESGGPPAGAAQEPPAQEPPAQEAPAQPGTFPFRDGDRVVFLGDSITEQRLYTTYLETYLLTRFPLWRLQFRNAGWSGDTAWLRTRGLPPAEALKRDVLDLNPTVVTINFGMNDFGYGAFRQELYDAHISSQTGIIKQLKAAGVLPVVLTPNAIEKNGRGDNGEGLNEALGRFAAGAVDVARREGVPYADQFTPYNAAINRLRATSPAARVTVGDEAHPQHSGQLMMASFILTALNAPALVSSATIDARTGAATALEGARLSDVVRSRDGVSFQRLDRALVFPIEDAARPALRLVPVAEAINRYVLRVNGLADGVYTVSVNGATAGRFSAGELGQGVNLGDRAGPLTRAGAKIMRHVRRKNDLYFVLWRQVRLRALSAEEKKRRTSDLERRIAREERAIDQLREPKPFRFEVRRTGPAGETATPVRHSRPESIAF